MTDELQRIRFLIKRDGEAATREWVERTLNIYREALAGAGNHPPAAHYRSEFEHSIRRFEQWLHGNMRDDTMTLSVEEFSRAREMVNGLLEELHLATYTFDVEPHDDGWEIRVECAAEDGWMTQTFAASREELRRGDDAGVRQRLLDAWAGQLAGCRRTR
ncbi:hypothetical protein [Thioalkalivibrio versutus]|uniref:hypothetical protein n=1 Tax=Thioalkalivibrio versutus TaxID=106634 RepID=UPI00037A587A|nr:hypothetical protein [Thioalkalivibrio versutus]OOC49713.1 hypothetical protein B0684_04140 [Thioalkalivibrio versutus]